MTELIDGMQNSVLVLESSKSGCKINDITLLKIKRIRLREMYDEGEIPYEAKTGSDPFFEITSIGNLQK